MVLIEDYWRALSVYSIGQVEKVVEGWISGGLFFPKPRELINDIHSFQIIDDNPLLTEPEPTKEDNRVGRLVCRWMNREQPKLHGKPWPEIYAAMKAYYVKHNIPWMGE